MKRKLLTMTFGLGLMTLGADLVQAQNARQCGPRDVVVQRLADGFGETRQALGLGTQGAVVEVFASEASGSWTITVTYPNGATCLVASGQAFETLAEALPPKGDGA
ncbi:hypothetical protein [Shimia abyssi]|uniref:Uncharacterized protein n=1 Tax=Shimia abyssi TaxID=1662395 RepID=A0A2P8FEP1_9RHOB|nr:hypothetical protein [Shimia abyssi]PSL20183.1 hypothetical protein CLV88_104244 [Shimia abyssi]